MKTTNIRSYRAIAVAPHKHQFTDALNCDVPLVPCDEIDSETQGCKALEGGQG